MEKKGQKEKKNTIMISHITDISHEQEGNQECVSSGNCWFFYVFLFISCGDEFYAGITLVSFLPSLLKELLCFVCCAMNKENRCSSRFHRTSSCCSLPSDFLSHFMEALLTILLTVGYLIFLFQVNIRVLVLHLRIFRAWLVNSGELWFNCLPSGKQCNYCTWRPGNWKPHRKFLPSFFLFIPLCPEIVLVSCGRTLSFLE